MNQTDELFRLRPEFSRCHCRCHGSVVMGEGVADATVMQAYLQSPPRFDDAMAWAESCETCEFSHLIAATVSAQVDMIEATERESLNIFRVKYHG